ncbi:hypothetical protein DPMN_024182 [Dreissena polymorpha]|uniref:Uncharacterized protein n=1 Tax=Dreissena polymorpha TaxID=45954 RepID=A0A9D4RCG5_DREPO|nr:hypothetical protein DPMN_024182 [Dreissena polymorpha]
MCRHAFTYFDNLQSQKALPYLTSALRKLTDYLSQLIQLDDEKLILENELLFISAEKRIVKDVAGTALKRPRVDVYLTGLTTTAQSPVECDANQVTFKVNDNVLNFRPFNCFNDHCF